MKITHETLQQFVRKHGQRSKLKIFAPHAEVEILPDGTADVHSVIEKAETFVFEGKNYTRAEFELFLDKIDVN